MKLGSWSLFQSIDRLVQLANMGGKVRVSTTLWVSHIDVLVRITKKDGILHINLANNTTMGDRKSKNNGRRGGLQNRTKDLSTI